MSNKQQNWFARHKILSIVIGLFLLLFIIAAATSSEDSSNNTDAQTSNETTSNDQAQTTYTLAAEAKAASQDTLNVSSTTNLPDGALLNIKVERVSVWEGETEERFFTVAGTTTTVQDGKYSTGVKVDDKKFLDFELAAGEVIKKLDENVKVTVYFDPEADGQPGSVVDAVGQHGEKLEDSPQKTVFGSATPNPTNRLEVELETPLAFPYEDQLPG